MKNKSLYHVFKGNRGKIIDILMQHENISIPELKKIFAGKYKEIDHRAFFQHLDYLKKIGLISFNQLKHKKGKPKIIIFHKDKFNKFHEEEMEKMNAFFNKGFPIKKQIAVLGVLKNKNPISTESFMVELYKSGFDSTVNFLIPELISLGYIENYYKISKKGLDFIKDSIKKN